MKSCLKLSLEDGKIDIHTLFLFQINNSDGNYTCKESWHLARDAIRN